MVIEVYDHGDGDDVLSWERYLITTDMNYLKLNKEEFLELYRQMTKIMVDEVVANYDPDKPRKGFGSDEPHKKKKD